MSTAGNIYVAFGMEIGDPANTTIPPQRLNLWLNRVVKEAVERTNCLWDTVTVSGLYDIEIVDYSSLAADTITLKTSLYTTVSTYTIAGAASNSAMATAIATQLIARTDIKAYSIGAHVYVCCIGGGTIETLTCSDSDTDHIVLTDGAESYKLSQIVTNIRRVEEVYSVDDSVHYKPVAYQEWARAKMDSSFDGFLSAVMPEEGIDMLMLNAGGANLSSASMVTISHLLWPTAISTASTEMPGILNHHDDMIVKGMLYYYYSQKAQYETALGVRNIFERWCRQAKKELRMQGKPQELSHFLRVAND